MEVQTNFKRTDPAMCWNDAIPLGNGFLGAMVYGHTGIEKIQLNEDSLWYGNLEDRVKRIANVRFTFYIRQSTGKGENYVKGI